MSGRATNALTVGAVILLIAAFMLVRYRHDAAPDMPGECQSAYARARTLADSGQVDVMAVYKRGDRDAMRCGTFRALEKMRQP